MILIIIVLNVYEARDVDEQFLLSVLSYIVCVCSRASVSVVCRSRDFITIVPSVTVCVRTVPSVTESSSEKRLKTNDWFVCS